MKKLLSFAKSGDAEYLCDDNGNLYIKRGDEVSRLSIFDRHLYNLRVFSGVPVLEIDGLRMQLVRDFETPLGYAREVVKALRIRKFEVVLDTCMGLGYTALEAAKKAAMVYTYEINGPVLTLARLNPAGKGLFEAENIRVQQGDISDNILQVADRSIDVVIHDPPRFSLAPALYSLAFYRQLARVLKPGGRLFHYVGSVGKGRRRDISKEVINRLSPAGFTARKIGRLQGIIAILKRF